MRVSESPQDDAEFNAWLTALDAVEFLKANAADDEFVFYATSRQTFIHTVLVPTANVTPPDMDDLVSWSFNAYRPWGVSYTLSDTPGIRIASPFEGRGTKSFKGTTRLVFPRDFEGRVGDKHYWEILQPFAHVFDLHYLEERNAFCRLDENGDVEDLVRILTVSGRGEDFDGTVITFQRKLLDEWMLLTNTVMVRTFEFIRRRLGFMMDGTDATRTGPTEDDGILYKFGVVPEQASFRRGSQIVRPLMERADLEKRYTWPLEDTREYASFIAHDWKNRVVTEISTAPGATANYFTKSALPFELSPAFFRPEVLQKYKADSDKYRLEDRAIHCRGAWSLTTYDINDAGQVHSYVCYLRDLPYAEQLYWKAYNEAPKAPISKRAMTTDFEGQFYEEYDPLRSLKDILQQLNRNDVPWWTLRSKSFDQIMYPVTTSADEWANELLRLDQLVVEGFKEKWLRRQAGALGRPHTPTHRSLKLVEECLIGLGDEEQHARATTAPLHEAHYLRSKLKGHASGQEATEIRKKALRDHQTYRKHYEALCTRCDEAIRTIAEAFKALR